MDPGDTDPERPGLFRATTRGRDIQMRSLRHGELLMTPKLIDHDRGIERDCENKDEAKEKKQEMIDLGVPEDALEIQTESEPQEAEPVEPDREPMEAEAEPVPEGKPELEDDPVDWMPAHFVDHIQGVPTLNRKGYAVMAERFNVSVTSEPVVRASETDFEYAEFKATAKTEDGTEYSGFGSAHVNRKDGDDQHLLNELAETRALKRAASWALGLGMTAKEEMDNSL